MRLFLRDFFMSMYTTAQLLAANEQKFKFDPLFLRLFFRESYPFTTEKVYLSQIPGLVNMALYVSPIVSGEVIRSRGGSTSEFTPGYVKPKHEVNPCNRCCRLSTCRQHVSRTGCIICSVSIFQRRNGINKGH